MIPSRTALLTNRSDRDVSRPGRWTLSRLATITLAVLVWSSLGARSARAAGCHVPERPVLGVRPAWDSQRHVEAWAITNAPAPPILERVPCSAEVLHPPVATPMSTGAADLGAAGFEPAIHSESLHAGDDAEILPPHRFRLDRPPR